MSTVNSIGYFEERFDSEQRWLATYLKFQTPPTPFYRVYTGGKHSRFMLATPKSKCHWGVILPYLEGMQLLLNPIDIAAEDMPITSITSADIEQFKEHNPDNPLQYWASFFADKLLRSSRHFLYSGDWEIYPMVPKLCQNSSYFKSSILQTEIHGLDYHLDWYDYEGDNLIPLKPLPDEHCGRVKWWRKKIREQSCPPLLFWWHEHTQTFVLVDGHARLKAYQLEQVQPTYLKINSFKQKKVDCDINHPQRIKNRLKTFHGIKQSLDKGNKPPTVETLNSIMLHAYGIYDYDCDYATLTPKVIAHLDDVFEQDLLAFLDDNRVDQDFLRLLLSS